MQKPTVFEILAIGEENPDFVSRKIQNFLNTDYSHIAILVDGIKVYHATGKGFHTDWLQNVIPGHIIRHRIKVEPRNNSYALGWLDGCIGTEYSQSQYLGFFFAWWPWLQKLIRKIFDNGRKKTICSEAAADFLKECCGYEIVQADFLSPKDVVNIALDFAGG